MTHAHLQCSTPEQIRLFLRGGLNSHEEEALQRHLDDCLDCRQLVSQAAADEASWREARQFFAVDTSRKAPAKPLDNRIGPVEESESAEPESIESLLKLLGPTDDPRMLGRIGAYEIVGVLGRGGMGIVFKAFEPSLNRYVAIKLLLPHLAASGAARMRFAREGKAAAAVIDDNVLPIFSVAEWQGIPYLVTQLSRGTTLQKRIRDRGPLELREILRLGMQTARGLAAAHAQGLVHRDVKPSNILLDGTVERALLTDFGLARAVDDASITCSGIIAGTPQYMSPEQARGGTVDARSDLFGLGSVLYTMCTGRPPFRADNSYAVLRLITDMQPRPIREVHADIPDWLCAIIDKLMAKMPEDRYQSASEVAELLAACLAHVQQPATVDLPKELREATKRSQRASRPPWTTYSSALLLVGLAIVAISLCLPWLKRPTRALNNRVAAASQRTDDRQAVAPIIPFVEIANLHPSLDGQDVEMAFIIEEEYMISGSVPAGQVPSFGIKPQLESGEPQLSILVTGDCADALSRSGLGPDLNKARGVGLQATGRLVAFAAPPDQPNKPTTYQLTISNWKKCRVLAGNRPRALNNRVGNKQPVEPQRPRLTCVLTQLNKPGTAEVEVSVGLDDGITPGDKLDVTHEGQIVGKVEITKSTASRSTARIIEVVPGKALDRGDQAKPAKPDQRASSGKGVRLAVPILGDAPIALDWSNPPRDFRSDRYPFHFSIGFFQ